MRRSRGELPVPVRLGRTRNTGLLYLPLYLPLYRAPLLIAYRTVPKAVPWHPPPHSRRAVQNTVHCTRVRAGS